MQGFHPAFLPCPEVSLRLLDLTDRFKVAVTISDIDQESCPVIHANQAFTQLTGYTTADVQGRSILNLHSGSQQRDLADQRAIALSEGSLGETTLFSRRADGSGFEELIYLKLMEVPGYTGWLISCHFDLRRAKWQNRLEFMMRNYELRARNAMRVLDTEAAMTHMLSNFAMMSEAGPERPASSCAA